jgi:3-oxoacyl-[acyl-carrier protein] reductase
MGKLTNKVALIVGGGGGIGRATAQLFAAEGAKVVVTMRTAATAARVVEEIRAAGGEASFVVGDAGISADITRMVSETEKRHGQLDILIHNAALFAPGAVQDISDELLDKAVDVNLKACFRLTRLALPLLKKAKGGGRIIVTTTPAHRTVVSGLSAYICTKMAVNGFVRSAALDLAPFNITVNEVGPGVTVSEMSGENLSAETLANITRLTPLGRLGQPVDIAKGMLYLASDDASYVTGHTLVIDGGGTLPHATEAIFKVG